jgi:Fe-S-cluster containining protein
MKNIREMTGEEVMNLPKLGLDDTFEFKCKACGKCCKHREDLLLTPYDMYRIASDLGRTPEEIFTRYCHFYEGATSHLPVVRVIPVPPNNACPFLRNKKCSIHEKKPVVCRVFPLARIYETEGGCAKFAKFVNNGVRCNQEAQTNIVRDWIGDVASEEAEAAGRLWGEAITSLYELVRPESWNLSDDARKKMLGIIFGVLYLNYKMDKPFPSQFESNIEAVTTLLKSVTEMKPDDLP